MYTYIYLQYTFMSTYKDVMRETWRALEEVVDEGKIRVLGVSNFDTGT
jgi:diketogulonate reductase-like aldo/keto reductase